MPLFPIRAPSEGLGVRTSTSAFWRVTTQPITFSRPSGIVRFFFFSVVLLFCYNADNSKWRVGEVGTNSEFSGLDSWKEKSCGQEPREDLKRGKQGLCGCREQESGCAYFF